MNAYGYTWCHKTRPRILRRAFGRFDKEGRYKGAARCERCRHIDTMHGGRSELDIAHLDRQLGNDTDDNLAALCRKCHRSLDYEVWVSKFRPKLQARLQKKLEALRDKLDAERPLLEYLRMESQPTP